MSLHVASEDFQTSLFDHAVAYAARGWSIIPLIGKEPATFWMNFQTQAPDKTTLRKLFRRKSITGLAVILGDASGGLAVRDFDVKEAYPTWAKTNPEKAACLPTVTTSRGHHVYGRLQNEAFLKFGDGELRGKSKQYVVLPPSTHPDGTIYSWLIDLPFEDLPLLPISLTEEAGEESPSTPIKPIACAHKREIETIIGQTLPNGPGQRNRRLFDLARLLKGAIPEAVPDELRIIVAEWHRQGIGFIRTKPFDESWSDFILAWKRIKRPGGCSFRAAADAAISDKLPKIANRYDGELRRLVALCWQLQCQWGDRPFPLGCRKAASFMGTSPIRAWRLLRTLEFDRVIRLVSKGEKTTGRSSEWHFIATEGDRP